MSDDDTFEMVIMTEEDHESLEEDLAYWTTATTMLSEILNKAGIPYDISEEAISLYLKEMNDDT